MRNLYLTLVCVSLPMLAGCQTMAFPGQASRLKREIAAIETRVVDIEKRIDDKTTEIASRTDGIHSEVRYRPLISWADQFSNGSEADLTVTFRQTSHDGYLVKVDRKCRLFPPWDQFIRAGYYARIHEGNSTKANLTIDRFTVTPRPSGLDLATQLGFNAKTQVQGQYEPPCVGASIGTNVGVEGEARANAVFRMALAEVHNDQLGYTVDLVSPNSIGLELSFLLGGFGRIRFTVPMDSLARRLTAGNVDLLFKSDGKILLPDGQVIGYAIGNANPKVETDLAGIKMSTDVTVSIQH